MVFDRQSHRATDRTTLPRWHSIATVSSVQLGYGTAESEKPGRRTAWYMFGHCPGNRGPCGPSPASEWMTNRPAASASIAGASKFGSDVPLVEPQLEVYRPLQRGLDKAMRS